MTDLLLAAFIGVVLVFFYENTPARRAERRREMD